MSEPEEQVDGVDGREITLPERVADRIEQRVPLSDFHSVDEYVAYVLEEVLERVEAEQSDEVGESAHEEEVEERLEALGYLDE